MNRRFLIAIPLFFVALITVLLLRAPTNGNPSLVISFSHYDYREHGKDAIVEVKNVGQATACYLGYAADSPFYELMVNDGTGWTNAPNRFWCGTGAGLRLLAPGGEERVRVYLDTNQTWKVGISYTKLTFRDRLPWFIAQFLPSTLQAQKPTYTAWGPPVPYYRSPVVNSQP